jgi:hypothetical protein
LRRRKINTGIQVCFFFSHLNVNTLPRDRLTDKNCGGIRLDAVVPFIIPATQEAKVGDHGPMPALTNSQTVSEK